jgi:prepilin-type processing-associated H-X9-DG protein
MPLRAAEDRMTSPEDKQAVPLDYASPSSNRRSRLLVFVWIPVILFGVVAVAWSLMPKLTSTRAVANEVKCGANLRLIGQAMVLYANNHQGQYPDTIGELVEEGIPTSVFVCSGSNDEDAEPGATTQETVANIHAGGHLSYIYLAKGMTNTGYANVVLVYEPLSNHQNKGMNVLFGDGHVEWFDLKLATKWLAELNAGHNPPRTGAVK